jgi:hypothetical protein
VCGRGCGCDRPSTSNCLVRIHSARLGRRRGAGHGHGHVHVSAELGMRRGGPALRVLGRRL